jgi:hypothetical protein
MDRIKNSIMMPAALEERLSAEDDPALWTQVLKTVAEDASTLDNISSKLYAEVGACSHWVRPHQTRWTAAGGFAFPIGYGDGEGLLGVAGIPGFDWSIRLLFNPTLLIWDAPPTPPTKRFRSVRVAVPSRTTRHQQGAVHTLWSPGTLDARHKRTVFYGFRNVKGVLGTEGTLHGTLNRTALAGSSSGPAGVNMGGLLRSW